jgi:hypothetical protein
MLAQPPLRKFWALEICKHLFGVLNSYPLTLEGVCHYRI